MKFTGHFSCSILAWTGQGTFDILTRAQLPGHIYYPGMPWSGYSKYPGQATQPVLRHMFLVIPRRSLSRVPLISWPGYDCQATFNTLASPGQGSWSSLVRPHDQSYAAYPWSYPGMAWPGYGSGFAVSQTNALKLRFASFCELLRRPLSLEKEKDDPVSSTKSLGARRGPMTKWDLKLVAWPLLPVLARRGRRVGLD